MAIKELIENEMPIRIARLPRDARGYPIPWFVHIAEDGKPDFRIIGRTKGQSRIKLAHKRKLCWVCGLERGRSLVFPVGPMCSITRTVPEPPCHYECAVYSVRVCPFLARPVVHRQEHNMPEDAVVAGVGIKRNPGVIGLWKTRDYSVFQSRSVVESTMGVLFRLGDPEQVEWWREGRIATTEEVWETIRSGLPAVAAMAIMDGEDAVRDLLGMVMDAARVIQPEGKLPDLAEMMLEAMAKAPPPEVIKKIDEIQEHRARAETTV